MPFAFVPADRSPIQAALFSDHDYAKQRAFFAAHSELPPTPLRRLHSLARALGVAGIYVKDETARFGLNAFKAAGALFAIAALRDRGELRAGETLVCASEGNHGRAVARAAREVGCPARVYLSASVAPARVSAIESEGAMIVQVSGTYDDALRAMAADARAHGWRVISDTALDDEPIDVPRLIMLGYTRLMDEAASQWEPGPPPDLIFVPGGVGGLLAAVADWSVQKGGDKRPLVVCVEPTAAACLQASAREGRPTTLKGPFETVMAGLRCGEVSRAGFSTVLQTVDAYVAIDDLSAIDAMRLLATGRGGDPRIRAGASGAAALGGLVAVMRDPALSNVKRHLGIGLGSRVLVLVTEGVTDPELFAAAVGNPKNEHSSPENAEP
jgi:diaminopropionate ammonia-lyase